MKISINLMAIVILLSGCGESKTISSHHKAMMDSAIGNCETYREKEKTQVCLATLEKKIQEALADDLIRNPQNNRW